MSTHPQSSPVRSGLLEGCSAPALFVNTAGAAQLLNVSSSFLNKARITGEGPPYTKIGSNVRYNVSAVLSWAAAQSRTSTSDRGVIAA